MSASAIAALALTGAGAVYCGWRGYCFVKNQQFLEFQRSLPFPASKLQLMELQARYKAMWWLDHESDDEDHNK
jgi:hypothetical protein